jgi:hypothetical protein
MSKINYDKVHSYVRDFLHKSIENGLDINYSLQLWNSNEIKNDIKMADLTKKPTDSNKPKKNTSAYLFFCSGNRKNVRNELGPVPKATDITKELAKRWNILKNSTDEDSLNKIKEYKINGENDKKRYDKEMIIYYKKFPKKEMKKNTSSTKRTAYMFFYQDKKESVQLSLPESTSNKEVRQKISEMWKELKNDFSRKEIYESYKEKEKE